MTAAPAAGGAAGGGRGGGFGGGMFSGSVGSVTPTADAVTLKEHHSFAELPDANYKRARTTRGRASARCSTPTSRRRWPSRS